MSPFTIFVVCIQALLIQVNYGAAKRYTLVNGPSTVSVFRPKLPCAPVLVPEPVPVPTVTSQQCGCGQQYGYSAAPVVGYSSGYTTGSSIASSSCGGYGGQGTGEVGVTGIIDACGNTCVKGAVPVLGSVDFKGCADACGYVTICGQCGCGCD